MTIAALLFTVLVAYFLLRLPRQWAPLPLLVGASYMTIAQGIEIGPVHFTVIRILVLVGVIRVLVRKERLKGGWKAVDKMMVVWSVCAVLSSFFHENFTSALVFRLGLVYDAFGLYYLMRVFIEDFDSILGIGKIVVIILIPVAAEMVVERVTGHNFFSVFGGVAAESEVRNGRIRAQGPFAHSILAGTVGAVCWPLALMFWKQNRKMALVGLATTGAIVLASSSSGPIMTSLFILFALGLWKYRARMSLVRWGAVACLIALDIAMDAPIYYLPAWIDLTGSSTGWHRAELMHSAISYLNEWWFAGTDYTRHWMPYGVPWSQNHIDITNHYIKMGVMGGLPLMGSFIAVLTAAFLLIGKARKVYAAEPEKEFLVWTLGAILFGHTATFFSVSYFDQSVVFLFLGLAMIGSLPVRKPVEDPVEEEEEAEEGEPVSENEPDLSHHR